MEDDALVQEAFESRGGFRCPCFKNGLERVFKLLEPTEICFRGHWSVPSWACVRPIESFPNLAFAEYDVLVGGEFNEPAWSSRMKLVRADSDLGT